MVYLAACALISALLGWDVARREINRRAALALATDDLTPRLKALDAKTEALAAAVEVQKKALENSLQEMRGLLAPVRRAVLNAVPDETRRQRKEG